MSCVQRCGNLKTLKKKIIKKIIMKVIVRKEPF